MNFLILGDGPHELAWARTFAESAEHRLWAAFPGFDEWGDVPEPNDLDDALAMAGVEAVIVGGGPEFRAEALRRVAAAGLPLICLHPPGPDSEAYYQVALSREETGAVIVPDLAARLHPGVEAVRTAILKQELGTFRSLLYEAPAGGDLVRHAFARMVDVVRALLGEIDSLNATGDPPGMHPSDDLIVHLRDARGRRAEVRTWDGPPEPARLVLTATEGTLTLEYPLEIAGPARLIRRSTSGEERIDEIEPWDPHPALLATLAEAIARRPVHPDLNDGTRATELAEATTRSLRRGRTIDLHYEEISEEASFKSVMTSTGCVLLFFVLGALPLSLVGPAFGLGWTLYIAYAIVPILVIFVVAQMLRFAIRKPLAERIDPQMSQMNADKKG